MRRTAAPPIAIPAIAPEERALPEECEESAVGVAVSDGVALAVAAGGLADV